MKSYVKNYDKGTVTEVVKNKTTGTVKGVAKIEVIDVATGNTTIEGVSENLVFDSVLNNKIAHQLSSMSTPDSIVRKDKIYETITEYAIRSIHMTTYSGEENPNLDFIKGSVTAVGTRVNRSSTPSLTSIDGQFNSQLSGIYPEPFGDLRIRTVYDWGADNGNGTFNSIFLFTNEVSSNAIPYDSTPRYLSIFKDDEVDKYTKDVMFKYALGNLNMSSASPNSNVATGNVDSNNVLVYPCAYYDTITSYPAFSRKYWIAKVNLKTGKSEYSILKNPDGTDYYVGGTTLYNNSDSKYSENKVGRLTRLFADEENRIVGTIYRAINPSNSSESSYYDGNMNKNEFKISVFNNDGTHKETQILNMSDVTFGNGKSFIPSLDSAQDTSGTIYIGGTKILIFGSFADHNGSKYKSVMNGTPGFIVYDYTSKTVTHKVSLADVLKVDPEADMSRIVPYAQQVNMCYPYVTIYTDGYNEDATTINQVSATYDISDLNNVTYVSSRDIYKSHTAYVVRTVDGKVILHKHISSSGTTSLDKHDILSLYYHKPFLKPLTHTLLPEPITKSDTQSMRITYDLVIPKEML